MKAMLDVKLVNRGEEGELILNGRLETTNAEDAERLFMQMADRFKNLTLNMKDLSYISSAGLRVVLKAFKKFQAKGGKLSVTNVNEYVGEVFEMTGFAGILNVK